MNENGSGDDQVDRLVDVLDSHSEALKTAVVSAVLDLRQGLLENHRQHLRMLSDKDAELDRLRNSLQRLTLENERTMNLLTRFAQNYSLSSNRLAFQSRFLRRWLSTVRQRRAIRDINSGGPFMRRYLRLWRQLIAEKKSAAAEDFWKDKLQEVTGQIVNDYEQELGKVRQQLADAQKQCHSRYLERQNYMEDVKKAFMRGVCALNQEALEAFEIPAAAASLLSEGPPPEVSWIPHPPPPFSQATPVLVKSSAVSAAARSRLGGGGGSGSVLPPQPPPSASSAYVPRDSPSHTPGFSAPPARPLRVPASSYSSNRTGMGLPPYPSAQKISRLQSSLPFPPTRVTVTKHSPGC